MGRFKGLSLTFLVLTVIFLGIPQKAFSQAVDDTTCIVKADCDNSGNIDAFNCLRHKIENGFNRTVQRACVDRILFDGVSSITLTKTLSISNDRDMDCEGNHPLCGDGISFLLDGGSGKVTLDVTGISSDACAIELKVHDAKLTHLNIQATNEQIQAGKVICDEGTGNDITGVTINGEGPEPTETPEPTPTATPTPTPTPPPEAPTELLGAMNQEDGKFQIDLTWVDNATTEEGFRVERGTVGEGETECSGYESLTTLTTDSVSYSDEAIAPNTTYCYRVFSYIGTVDSTAPSNEVQVITPELILDAPTGLSATALDDTTIYLIWYYDDTVALTGFRLERGDENCTEGSFNQIALLPDTVKNYADEGLDPMTTYCYRVQAYLITPAVDSDFSDTVTETTLELGATPVPTPTATPTASPTATPTATPTPDPDDLDGDGVNNDVDNCPNDANAGQENQDGDSQGDACDSDIDGDGVSNDDEINQGTDPTDSDSDDDGVNDKDDNCPSVSNPGQEDADNDQQGDPCDLENPDDLDGDGLTNNADNCPNVANPDQADEDQDGIGDACELVTDINVPTTSGGCILGAAQSAGASVWLILSALLIFAAGSVRRSKE